MLPQVLSTVSALPKVLSVQPQKVLSRVKRQGVQTDSQFFSQFQFTALGSHPLSFASLPSFVLLSQSAHNLLSQSAQGLRDERELAVREQCFVSTIETKESPSRRCVFPFEYKVSSFKYSSDDGFQNGGQTRMLAVFSS